MKEIKSDYLESALNVMIANPLEFKSLYKINDIIDAGLSGGLLRSAIKRIYDLNEAQLHEMSNANSGIIGFLNKKSTNARLRTFAKKVNKRKAGGTDYLIYAEGDSWFQFPIFVEDIIDHLNTRKNFFLYSDAFGGDWITNILYEEQYVKGLSTYKPDYFLISGGGNDLLGNHRLGIMIDNPSNLSNVENRKKLENRNCGLAPELKRRIVNGQRFINGEFYALLNLLELQYSLIFGRLYSADNKHRNLITITQGYDYPFPTNKIRFSFRYPLQPLINKFMATGNWLYTPLKVKNINNTDDQNDILFTMIYEYNEMLISLAKKYDNVYHVDNRGLAPHMKDWFDELHLKNDKYRVIARAYGSIIESGSKTKVVRSVDFL